MNLFSSCGWNVCFPNVLLSLSTLGFLGPVTWFLHDTFLALAALANTQNTVDEQLKSQDVYRESLCCVPRLFLHEDIVFHQMRQSLFFRGQNYLPFLNAFIILGRMYEAVSARPCILLSAWQADLRVIRCLCRPSRLLLAPLRVD